MTKKADILVQIPAYRDAELSHTLREVINKADKKYSMRVCVLWQKGKREKISPDLLKHSFLEIDELPFEHSLGASWARRKLQEKWQGEKYSLLLDSHHRLVKNWNLHLVNMYQRLKRKGITKPIISAYLPKYFPENDPRGRYRHPLKVYPLEERCEGMLYRLTGYPIIYWKWLTEPVEAQFLSLHFLFTAGIFNAEVPFNTDNYYAGDELLTSLKAFTNGYDIYHPHFIIGWHQYERSSRIMHWKDHARWHMLERKSLHILKNVFEGTSSGMKELGTRRTIRQFEEFIQEKLVKTDKE